MKIGGIIDISTKDIPGKACMVIFTVGCNFGCQFCHNKHLLRDDAGRKYSIKHLMSLAKNNYLVNAVSISGGEPALQPDLPDLCHKLSEQNKFVSIDTNGSHPDVIERVLPSIKRVALDLKTSLSIKRYEQITNTSVNIDNILKTFHLLNDATHIQFEVRTTYIDNLLVEDDIKEIITFLKENLFTGNFVLQQYQYSEGVGEEFREKFQKPEHNTLLNFLKPYLNDDFSFDIYLRDEVVGYSEIHDVFQQIL
ncbi:MAG: Pyruvate formate-lyase 1-activating enzyme [Promethearchaeota archaeon]|nr:MAG: Pyruvate formate-lyase 1-activating enzyme [Candidatus Lokiarchaeota archaeon]